MHVGGGSGESATTHTMKIVNRVRLYRRRRGDRRAWVYFVLTVLVEIRRAVLGHHWSWSTVGALLRPAGTAGRSRRQRRMAAEVTVVRKILLIAPACDGQDVGESWLAHQWAAHLSARADLTVLTTYKQGHVPASQQLPGVRVIEWGEPPLIGRLERLNSLMQPNYVPFYLRARRWIRARLAEGEHFDVAHQVVPVAMRYPCPAAGLGVPLVLGPVGGSLESPPEFVAEEGATPWYQRLRAVDRARLRHDPLLRRSYESADCVVGIAPYVLDLLDGLRLKRFEVMSETAVNDHPPTSRPVRTGQAPSGCSTWDASCAPRDCAT